MPAIVRALLWIVFIVAPGGVFLLPLLLGDAMARRKKAVSHVTHVEPTPGLLAAAPLTTR